MSNVIKKLTVLNSLFQRYKCSQWFSTEISAEADQNKLLK